MPPGHEPIEVDGVPKYEVEEIIASRRVCRSLQYCVSWKGYPSYDNSWVSAADCANCLDLVAKFHAQNPTALGPPKSLLALKLPKAHKNYSLASYPDGGIHPQERGEDNVKFQVEPYALDRAQFPHRKKKGKRQPAKPLESLEDLAHTVDERYVLAYPPNAPQLPCAPPPPSIEKSLFQLDCLLSEFRAKLKSHRASQSDCDTSGVESSSTFPPTEKIILPITPPS